MILLSKPLRYFIITAQEKSIQSAAAKLFITPSPLCRTIKSFEDILGSKLYIRKKNGICLTEFGHELFQKMLPLYEEAISIEESYTRKNKIQSEDNKNIKIGVDHQEHYYLSTIFNSNSFKEKKIDISIEKFPPNEININTLLIKDQCSVFFSFKGHEHSSDIEYLKIPVDKYKLAIANQNKDVKSFLIDLFSTIPLVLPHHHPLEPEWLAIDNHFKENKIKPRRIITQNINDQLTIIESGNAAGIIPESVKKIISSRNYQVKLLSFPSKKKEFIIERHIYFAKKNKKSIEDNILNIILKN